MKKQFKQFLEENGALEEYIKERTAYLKEYRGKKNVLSMNSEESNVAGAFFWDDTELGYDYWNNLDTEWINLLKTIA